MAELISFGASAQTFIKSAAAPSVSMDKTNIKEVNHESTRFLLQICP